MIHLCTATVPSSLKRNNSWTSSFRSSMCRAPPETTNASFLLFKSPFNSLVASKYFRRISCSIQQSPNRTLSSRPLRRCACCFLMLQIGLSTPSSSVQHFAETSSVFRTDTHPPTETHLAPSPREDALGPLVTRHALASTQEPPILFRSIACDTFARSLVLRVHTPPS